jgi:hypothetical protein
MKTYIYKNVPSNIQGFDRRVSVYRIKNNRPVWLGCDDFQTRSWAGASSEAQNIATQAEKLPKDAFKFQPFSKEHTKAVMIEI